MNEHLERGAMNEPPLNQLTRRALFLRIALIPVVVVINSAINLFPVVMARRQLPGPALLRLLVSSALPAIAWVALSIPVQIVARRLVRAPISTAVMAHAVLAMGFVISHSVLTVGMRIAAGLSRPGDSIAGLTEQQIVGFLALNLLVYAAIVAGTLAWDNWRLSVRRQRTAAHLAAELTRAELAALRSRVQPHFLFNALHGISSVMDTDVPKARRMMVALSHLLRSSLSAGDEYVRLEQELELTRDYLELQNMRFEERLRYDLQVDADAQVRVPSFILQPLVENAVIHGMADRPVSTSVRVVVRQLANEVEIDLSDDGPGFPQDILDGRTPPGVGLGALRARLRALPAGPGTMVLRNRPEGGAQVILRVPIQHGGGSHA